MNDFAHLHLHTEYSLLDGMGRINQYIERAQSLGMNHMAVTDHGVMYAALEWYNAATAAGMHPIIGMEAYLAEGSAKNRDQRKSYHLLLLAENETGYRNLLKLASEAALNGFYYRPRIDLELLHQYREGIIATSACLGGPVANNFLTGQPEKAYDYASKLAEIFGKDRFYIELQDHGLKEQIETNRELIPLARKLDLPLLASNDVHYCHKEDAPAQDLLVCVQTNTNIHDPKRMKQETDEFYLKSPNEMALLFGEQPEALRNTIRIAEMCHLDLGFKGYQLPEFEVPEGFSSESYLRHLCEQGAMQRYGTIDGDVGSRLDYEMGIINSMGFTNYFLIVWDFIKFAKESGVLVGPGRGSSAGSIVAYTLDITGLDPLKYNLIFERFLNPSRISMPDIDMDFADDRRGEVIDYVVRKYGDDRVAQIVTFGTLKAKAAVKDVGRAMGLTFGETDRVAKLIPQDPKMTIDRALGEVPELSKLYDDDSQVRELVDSARKVEGLARHSSTHAAGVVISRDPLVHHVPLQYAGGKASGEVTTQYTQNHLESDLGLLKMDFLGLKTLTVLGKALDNARAGGAEIELDDIPLEDEASFELMRRGETVGVFQLESGFATRLTVDAEPGSFDDVVALMALVRPGPMEFAPEYIARKHGREEVVYPHPELEPILDETYGVALYQEQVMRIANVLAGFSMADADGLRKGMGKKKPEVIAMYKDQFLTGAIEKGVPEVTARAVWEMMEKFAGYGFPKAHSAAYAVIGMQTAYMKAHYPVEFMAALMSTEMNNSEKTVFNVAECRRAGIAVLPPDVNRSVVDFSVEQREDGSKAVRFGLGAVKGVGVGAVTSIIETRRGLDGERFASLDAFCDAVDWSSTTKSVPVSLAKTGAMEEFGHRAAVLAVLEQSIGAAQKRQKAAARGQMDLFGMMADAAVMQETSIALPDVEEADSRQVLEWEKEFLGLYLSSHPLMDVTGNGVPNGFAQVVDLAGLNPGQKVRVIGMVTGARRITTRANKTMAVVEVEDLTGTVEMVVFPSTFDQISQLLEVDTIRVFSGKVDERGDSHQIIVEAVTDTLPEMNLRPLPTTHVVIELSLSGDYWEDVAQMQALDELLRTHEGECPVVLLVQDGGQPRRMKSRSRFVSWTEDLSRELSGMLGEGKAWTETIS